MSLRSKLAVITGGGTGIGCAIAHRFAREGATCVLVGRDAGRLQRAAAEVLPRVEPAFSWQDQPEGLFLMEETGHVAFAGSVMDPAFWKRVGAAFKNMHILVNAAGIAQNSVLARTSETDIADIMNTNLLGTTLGCRAAAAAMLRSRISGASRDSARSHCIINVSSTLALKAGTGASVYAASKAGVLGLTRALSVELGGRGIRVNAIVPGYIETSMTKTSSGQSLIAKPVIESIPLGRMGTTEEVADAAVFLATNEYANGCMLNLDGGLGSL